MPKSKRDPLALAPTILNTIPIAERMLVESCPGLIRDIQVLSAELDDVRRRGDAVGMARAFVALHRVKEAIDAIINKEGGRMTGLFDDYKKEFVPSVFEMAGVPNVSLVEGFRVGVTMKIQASVKGDRRDDAYQWLRDNDLGALIVETVNASTLSATAKILLEQDAKELPEDLFTVYDAYNTSVTQTK